MMQILDFVWVLIISVSLFVVLFLLVPYVKSKTTKAQREDIISVAGTFVKAAEQLIKGTKMGSERYRQVVEWFKDIGFDLEDTKTKSMVDAAIEKSVFDFINK